LFKYNFVKSVKSDTNLIGVLIYTARNFEARHPIPLTYKAFCLSRATRRISYLL